MKRLLLLALCSGSWCEVFAKDSDWKICKGEAIISHENVNLVVNVFEHRTSKGRAADITFIYGGNVLRGALNTSDVYEGALKLKGDTSATSYKGLVEIDYGASKINFSGKITLNKITNDLSASLNCETL